MPKRLLFGQASAYIAEVHLTVVQAHYLEKRGAGESEASNLFNNDLRSYWKKGRTFPVCVNRQIIMCSNMVDILSRKRISVECYVIEVSLMQSDHFF